MPTQTKIQITRPQLRDALRRLEANVTAEEVWGALQQQAITFADQHAPDDDADRAAIAGRITEQGLM